MSARGHNGRALVATFRTPIDGPPMLVRTITGGVGQTMTRVHRVEQHYSVDCPRCGAPDAAQQVLYSEEWFRNLDDAKPSRFVNSEPPRTFLCDACLRFVASLEIERNCAVRKTEATEAARLTPAQAATSNAYQLELKARGETTTDDAIAAWTVASDAYEVEGHMLAADRCARVAASMSEGFQFVDLDAPGRPR